MSTPEPPETPQQPAPQVYYVPAAPSGLPKWAWFLFGFLSAAFIAGVGIVGVIVIGIAASGGLDDFTPSYVVTQERVEKATSQPCKDMTRAGEAVTAQAPPKVAAARLETFARSARGIATAIDSARPDTDATLWRDDLTTLADAVEDYAADVRAGRDTTFEMPEKSGRAVTTRIWFGEPGGCEIPVTIEALDPEVLKDQYSF